jgi:RNA-binding protein
MPKLELTAGQRRELRAAAHSLHPVVLIGDRGLTAPVLEEIDRNLNAHGLIKVHVAGAERDTRETMLAHICDTLSCAAVHHIGKTLIIYRPDAAAQAADALPTTRATHRKSEPYVPKKQAAHGHDAKPAARRTAARGPKIEPAKPGRRPVDGRPGQKRSAADTAARASSHAARPAIAHGIPRRSDSGSALTLRAGARRGRTTRS